MKHKNTMIYREITPYLQYVAQHYPVVAVTGPRQSGKTTLVKELFKDKPYVSLEDLDEREFATEDPRGFLNRYKHGAIIDEAQNVPHLFSYLQTLVDASKKPGEFILTGSQNFLLLEKISQSLAGRVAISHLLPLSYQEVSNAHKGVETAEEVLFKGLYPKLYDTNLLPTDWYKTYISTYIERDVRQIQNVINLSKFQLFLRLCAGRVGQLLNQSSLAIECGVDAGTVRAWLSILEASFIIFLLKPHHKNFNKRLVKQPKLYFYDPGVACYLLGIEKPEDLITHYMKGAIFENFVMTELVKKRFNQGKDHNLYFWRDQHGHEVDGIIALGEKLIPVEVKSGQTINSDFFKNLEYWKALSGAKDSYLVYGGDESYLRQGTQILSWKEIDKVSV